MDNKVQELLKRAQMRIAQGWTQDQMARDSADRVCDPDSKDAVCWCALGAIRAEGRTPTGGAAERRLAEVIGRESLFWTYEIVTEWNDALDRTKEEVLTTFDRAMTTT